MHQHDEAYVTQLAVRVLRSAEKAAEWLARPALQLGGRAPRELLTSIDGARRVEELLRQIDDNNRLHGAPTRHA
jgi:uncharacterized protein (DUF2384 family)